jgi:hypothetical protein
MRARRVGAAQPALQVAGREARVGELDKPAALIDVAVSSEDEVQIAGPARGCRIAQLIGELAPGGEQCGAGRRSGLRLGVRK